MVIVLLLLGVFVSCFATPGVDAKLTKLYSHYFAKWRTTTPNHYVPVNITNTFTADDEWVLAFMTASFPTSTNLTRVWYDPTGALYDRSSVVWTCYAAQCDTYSYQKIRDTVMAKLPGVWRYDHFADGVLLYSDRFTIAPAIHEQYSWVFHLDSPTHARVDFTITIHPFQGVLNQHWTIGNWTEWNARFGGEGISNISARDYTTNKSLTVTPMEAAADGRIHVHFGGPREDGYTFVLCFDLDNPRNLGYSATDGTYWLKWGWSVVGGIESIPQQVTVVLPPSFNLKDIMIGQNDTVRPVQGADYTTGLQGGRMSVSFSALILQNSFVEWAVEYVPSGSNTTIVSSNTSQSTGETAAFESQTWMSINPFMLGLALAVIAVFAVWWIIKHHQRKR